MTCANCRKNPAVLHFTGQLNGASVSMDLCEACARQFGVHPGAAAGLFSGSPLQFPSIPNALAALLEALAGRTVAPNEPAKACPRCRWTMADFRRSGNLGCPDCYTTFRAEITPIVESIQGAATHRGRRVARPKKPLEAADSLRAKLDAAVREERFEDAARLRDRLRTLEEKKGMA